VRKLFRWLIWRRVKKQDTPEAMVEHNLNSLPLKCPHCGKTNWGINDSDGRIYFACSNEDCSLYQQFYAYFTNLEAYLDRIRRCAGWI